MASQDIRLTQFSHGAGCGCKLAPAVLERILSNQTAGPGPLPGEPGNPLGFGELLVGNDARDDAAVLDLGDGRGLISTTDFFMPIVDDPHTFGRIAAANAISDVYAMGGEPVLAIGILGWPVDKLPPEVAGTVIEGARSVCAEAGMTLAGGHSIDSPEPIFGLAVNGLVELASLKRNGGAQPGDRIFLTKPLGVGLLATAEKRGVLEPDHVGVAAQWMTRLNRVGRSLAAIDGVTAMTDVTGFGLLGHLGEVCAASGVSAQIIAADVPRLPGVERYIELGAIPGGTRRNWDSYGDSVAEGLSDGGRALLCDPQTSGGLLVCVRPDAVAAVRQILGDGWLAEQSSPIGTVFAPSPGGRSVLVIE